jgi:hypothetical protein
VFSGSFELDQFKRRTRGVASAANSIDNVALRRHSRRRILDALHALHMEAEAGTTERLIVQLLAAVFQEHGSQNMLDALLTEVETMDL